MNYLNQLISNQNPIVMIKQPIYFTLMMLFLPLLFVGQDECTAYLPGEGSKLTYHNFDKKGKLHSTTTTEITSVKIKGDTTYYKVHQLVSTGKKKNDVESDLVFKCSGDNFMVDMRSVLNQEMMEAYKDATLTVTSNNMIMPGNLEPGMELEDGEVNMKMHIEYITTTLTCRAFYREVESIEDITTAAGTFTAYKIKGYFETKISFARFAWSTIEWYVPDVGMVRTESYDKKDKLIGYSELQNIEQ